MKAEQRDLIKAASARLRLQDIVLVTARFERPAPPPEDPEEELIQQYKRGTAYSIEGGGERSEGKGLVTVNVALGTRLVRQSNNEGESDAQSTVVVIEAEYVAIYEMTEHIAEDAVKAFSESNAVHNIWPFWRQHVFDICQHAKLPILSIPLMAGVL